MGIATVSALICLVVGVTDGDTLKARCGVSGAFEQIKVRLAEIDAPERRQPFGNQSRQSLTELCLDVDAVVLPISKDRYGRTVARVECKGTDASAHQVRTGLAWAYTKYLTDPEMRRWETAAREAHIGLWSDANPFPPWEWRK